MGDKKSEKKFPLQQISEQNEKSKSRGNFKFLFRHHLVA